MRLDTYLFDKGYFESRAKAQDAIKEGLVSVDQKTVTKSSFAIEEGQEVSVIQVDRYVSRAGDKLDGCIIKDQIDLKDKVVVDIGSSTGGFTDCCLQHGARKVYCIDVGTNQLAAKLRQDPRVVVRENTNARYLKKADFDEEITFICMDVSFISCTYLFPVISDLLKNGEHAVILVKPQFEVGSKYLNKQGVVKDPKVREKALQEIISLLSTFKLVKCSCMLSNVIGRSGNQEYLLHVVKQEEL